MKILIKSFIIIILSIVSSYSACDLIAEFGEKKEVFEKREIIGRPFPLEYPELEVFPVLADDICPNQKLKDVGIEYKFLNNELVAINFVALNDDRNLVSEKLLLKIKSGFVSNTNQESSRISFSNCPGYHPA